MRALWMMLVGWGFRQLLRGLSGLGLTPCTDKCLGRLLCTNLMLLDVDFLYSVFTVREVKKLAA